MLPEDLRDALRRAGGGHVGGRRVVRVYEGSALVEDTILNRATDPRFRDSVSSLIGDRVRRAVEHDCYAFSTPEGMRLVAVGDSGDSWAEIPNPGGGTIIAHRLSPAGTGRMFVGGVAATGDEWQRAQGTGPIRFGHGGVEGDPDVVWELFGVFPTEYVGGYLDGDSPGWWWTGERHRSVSRGWPIGTEVGT